MDTDITQLFIHLLQQFRSVDIAHSEFVKMLADDSNLRSEYREWCHTEGYLEKHGFFDFCEQYLESQNDIWQTLTDYDEQ